MPESAGILLFRRGRELELLLAHPGGPFWQRRDKGAWSVPKGEPEEGEDLKECALRELCEELGTIPDLGQEDLLELGSVRQRGGKLVHGFAAEADFDPATLVSMTFEMEWPPRSGTMREFPEVDRVEWFRAARAREKLNPAQVELVDRLLDHLGLVERADAELGSDKHRG